jgi:ribosome-binding protein aMBF1 (putative translation factor)
MMLSGGGIEGIRRHWRKAMIVCDLCGQAKECQAKEIEGKEYDICSECWNPLAEKLSGKGRVKKDRETVFLPPSRFKEREDQEPKPLPGGPPKIWSGADRPQ